MSESEVKEDDNETEHNSTAAPNPSEIKKKRKKRKKRSGKHGAYHRSSEDNADVCEATQIDKMCAKKKSISIIYIVLFPATCF